MNLLRSVCVVLVAAFVLIGAAPVPAKVLPPVEVRSHIADAIRQHVASRVTVPAEDLRVSVLSVLSDTEVVAVGSAKSASGSFLERPTDRAVFGVDVVRSDHRPTTMWVTARVERAADVVVARRPLRRQEVLTADDLEVQARVIGLRDVTPAPTEALIGRRMVRAVPRGAVLGLEHVEETPVIRRGEIVLLVAETGGVRIVARGRAKEDGYAGRQIPVLNADSGKIVYGEVVDASTVSVWMAP